MAPMIDMVFLLLVFFMTVSTLAKESRPELELAESTTASVPENAPPRDIITVKPDPDGLTWYWHNRKTDLEGIRKQLAGRAGGEGELLLRGPPDLPWEAWEKILQACRSSGIGEVVFATFED